MAAKYVTCNKCETGEQNQKDVKGVTNDKDESILDFLLHFLKNIDEKITNMDKKFSNMEKRLYP